MFTSYILILRVVLMNGGESFYLKYMVMNNKRIMCCEFPPLHTSKWICVWFRNEKKEVKIECKPLYF